MCDRVCGASLPSACYDWAVLRTWHLLLSALLLLSGPAWANGLSSSHAQQPPVPLVPAPRPEIVSGELRTERFRLLYTEKSKGSAEHLAQRIEEARTDFRNVLGRDWPGEMEVRVGLGREELQALALPGSQLPTWAEALAYPAHGILLLNAASLAGPEGDQVLRHELAHVALGRLAQGWPRWFQEGFAMHVAGERLSVSRYTALFRAIRLDRVFPFEDLETRWPDRPSDVEIAYAQSESFFAYLLDRHGPAGFSRLLDAMAAGEDFRAAFATAFKVTFNDEERTFREGLPRRYGWLPITVTSSLLWIGAAGLCVVAYLRVRVVKRRRLEAMEEEELAEEAARRILEAESQEPAEELSLPTEEDQVQEESEARPPKATLH